MYIIEIVNNDLLKSNFYKVDNLEEFKNINSSEEKTIIKVISTIDALRLTSDELIIKCKTDELCVMTCYHIINIFRLNLDNQSVNFLVTELYKTKRNNLFYI